MENKNDKTYGGQCNQTQGAQPQNINKQSGDQVGKSHGMNGVKSTEEYQKPYGDQKQKTCNNSIDNKQDEWKQKNPVDKGVNDHTPHGDTGKLHEQQGTGHFDNQEQK